MMEFYIDTERKIIVIDKPIDSDEFKKFMRKLPNNKGYKYMSPKEYEKIKSNG